MSLRARFRFFRPTNFGNVTHAVVWGALILLLVAPARSAEPTSPRPIRGLPFNRLYSIDEIGKVSRGARLSFDQFGRLAVLDKGGYFVLNDGTWLNLSERQNNEENILNVVHDGQGHAYFGTLGSWGIVDYQADGVLHPRTLVPASAPKWAKDTNFTDIIITKDGVYFGGFYGVVFWNSSTHETLYFEASAITQIVLIDEHVYTCSRGHGIALVDIHAHALNTQNISVPTDLVFEQWSTYDHDHILVSTNDNRILRFDGKTAQPWLNQLGSTLPGRVTGMQHLADGNIAIAITGYGLCVFSPQGEVHFTLTSPEYHRITYLASNESGVLWAVTESGVEKILYDKTVSVFGQRLGLPVSWPQVSRWNDRVVVISGGRLYEEQPGEDLGHTHFQLVPDPKELWGLAASGAHLLVANASGIFAATADKRFETILTGVSVDRLVMIDPNLCFFVGSTEIGALRWENGHWIECAPRIAGVGYPSNVLSTRWAAWLELGANRAVRVSLKNGKIETRSFETFPWREPHWINVSAIGSTVILNSPPEGRIYFDEETETLCERPQLQELFEQSPYSIARIYRDTEGVLWASHDRGVMLVNQKNGHYEFDTSTFDIVSERWPTIHILAGNDVWFSSGQSLYHVDRRASTPAPAHVRPVVVSMLDGSGRNDLSKEWKAHDTDVHVPYLSNSISFRFFGGTYSTRLSPTYEFRLSGSPHSNWTAYEAGPPLTLTNLREGAYQLEVRMLYDGNPTGEHLLLSFIIDPPWYRTWYAYILYIVAGFGTLLGLLQWFVHRTRAHSVILEKQVDERTNQLRAAMEKLNQETKNAAVLAERGRLAGEIHDSIQQGLSGLILQLDATLKMPGLTPEIRSRLNTARSMVSFSRHEVQNAIWDLESPLLEGGELTQALQKLINLISVGPGRVELKIEGPPFPLSQSIQHHLLRIAQEALTNAVRHAEADTIVIRLIYHGSLVELNVEDDGKGFETTKVLSKGLGHFGLRGLKVRADKIGAELSVVSTVGQGTRLRVLVPPSELSDHEVYATGRA